LAVRRIAQRKKREKEEEEEEEEAPVPSFYNREGHL
jgi:hypothetical protein